MIRHGRTGLWKSYGLEMIVLILGGLALAGDKALVAAPIT